MVSQALNELGIDNPKLDFRSSMEEFICMCYIIGTWSNSIVQLLFECQSQTKPTNIFHKTNTYTDLAIPLIILALIKAKSLTHTKRS